MSGSRPGLLSALIAAAAAALPACDAPPDPYWLTGAWRFDAESKITLSCPGLPDAASQSLEGVSTRLAEIPGGVELDLGCSCHVQLTNDGRVARSGQQCDMVVSVGGVAYDVSALVDGFTITAPDGRDAAARQTVAVGSAKINEVLSSCTFLIDGRLSRTDDRRPRCGSKRTAVGVLPYFTWGIASCPIGAGTDGVQFSMVDDNRTGCGAVSGDIGEEPWTLPEAPRQLSACDPNTAAGARTQLAFCKVDGQLFKPVAGIGRGNSYALLQLGDECPEGSVSVQKKIDNDDETRTNGHSGDIMPNLSTNDAPLGTATVLNFCLFRGVQEETPSAVSFPELGFPYAVFHPFEGPQPTWVISKRWIRSDDESSPSNGNAYEPSGGASVEELKTMILDADTDTIFDIARVR